MKVSKNFSIFELVHPLYIEEHGQNKMVKVLQNLAAPMLQAIEDMKTFVSGETITVNNYMWDADYKSGGWEAIKDRKDLYVSSGLRHFKDPVGAGMSAHYYMQAVDLKFRDRDIQELQQSILETPYLHPCIVRMEDPHYTRSWLHIQTQYRKPNELINVFKP
ncbi:MAG: hypothetical protein PF444_08510 [Bacteroidales bacterium]|jgi:hypothetical protein|nr:hypothetical protein [Bacteroidales bacterium]